MGANVLVEGTTNGMVTNSKGEFALNVTAGARLSVSFIGYDAAQVEVGNRTHLTVVLKENNQLLDEVVVIGYGVQKKVNLSLSLIHIWRSFWVRPARGGSLRTRGP